MACCPKCPSWWCHSSLVTAWGGLSRLLAALHARDAPLRRPVPSGEAVRRGREGRPTPPIPPPPLALQVRHRRLDLQPDRDGEREPRGDARAGRPRQGADRLDRDQVRPLTLTLTLTLTMNPNPGPNPDPNPNPNPKPYPNPDPTPTPTPNLGATCAAPSPRRRCSAPRQP
eukprot:scaffold122203_cov54-Phaeocystis_antarctica.AAC.3